MDQLFTSAYGFKFVTAGRSLFRMVSLFAVEAIVGGRLGCLYAAFGNDRTPIELIGNSLYFHAQAESIKRVSVPRQHSSTIPIVAPVAGSEIWENPEMQEVEGGSDDAHEVLAGPEPVTVEQAEEGVIRYA